MLNKYDFRFSFMPFKIKKCNQIAMDKKIYFS
jgi:hypothetical protein